MRVFGKECNHFEVLSNEELKERMALAAEDEKITRQATAVEIAMEEIKETNTGKEKELTCMEFYENMVDIASSIPGKDVMNSVALQSIAYSLAKIGDTLCEKENEP
jgi:hypothetical protein